MNNTSLNALMAEEALSEFVMNLLKWIESLHEKNLKYEAQVAGLKRDLDDAKAQLFAYQNPISIGSTNTTGIELKVPMTSAADITSPETSSATTSISSAVAQSTASQQQQAQLNHHQQQAHSSINCDLQHQQHLVQQQQPTQHHLLHQQQQPHQQQLQHQPAQHHNNHQHQVLYQPMAASQAFMHQQHQYLWTSYDPSTSGVIGGGNQNPYYEQYSSSAQAFAQQQQ